MVSVEEFSSLLDALYSAAVDPDHWQHFLTLLSKATESRVSVFLCADTRLGVLCRAQGGTSTLGADDILAYNQRYARSDPFRGPSLRDPRPRIVSSEELLPNGGLLQSDMYRDLLGPNDCRYGTIALLTMSIRRLEVISIWRSEAQGPMGGDALRVLELAFPHIQRALEVRQMLGVSAQTAASAETIADASRTPTFLLTESGELVHSNAAGTELVAAGGVLTTQEGELTPLSEPARKAFRALLRTASTPPRLGEKVASRALALPRTNGAAALQVVANPIPPDVRARTGADVLVLVSDPDAPAGFPDAMLADLYRLTPAETEVANGLLMGFSLDEIAGLRRVSVGTVRGQLKSILSKTGAERQSELVRLLMSLPQGAAVRG
jgi:DNA-binding CsgD family transcriptional regulator